MNTQAREAGGFVYKCREQARGITSNGNLILCEDPGEDQGNAILPGCSSVVLLVTTRATS